MVKRAYPEKEKRMIQYWIFSTALGKAGIVVSEKGVCRVILPGWSKEKIQNFIKDQYPESKPGKAPAPKRVQEAINYIERYFCGSIEEMKFSLDLSKLGEFQKKVLELVSKIEPGETRSYSWLAERLGNKKVVRAVAQALAHNPVPLFIPCHRVIGKDGSLKGFSAPGGVNLKNFLLKLEQRLKDKARTKTPL